MLGNEEIKTLITAFGTGIGDYFDMKKLRYGKTILLCDADVEWLAHPHAPVTLLYRHFKPLIEEAVSTSASRRCTAAARQGDPLGLLRQRAGQGDQRAEAAGEDKREDARRPPAKRRRGGRRQATSRARRRAAEATVDADADAP